MCVHVSLCVCFMCVFMCVYVCVYVCVMCVFIYLYVCSCVVMCVFVDVVATLAVVVVRTGAPFANTLFLTHALSFIFFSSLSMSLDLELLAFHLSDFISLSGFILNDKFSYPNNYLCKFQHLMKKYI